MRSSKFSVQTSVLLKLGIVFGLCFLFFPYSSIYTKLNSLSSSGNAMLVWGGAFNRTVFILRIKSMLLVFGCTVILFWGVPTTWNLSTLTKRIAREKKDFSRWIKINFKREKKSFLLLGLFFLLGSFLRLKFLNRAMQIDESEAFLGYVAGPFISIFANYYPSDHLLHNVFTRAFVAVFGTSPVAIRLSAFIPGLILIPAVYFFCRQFFKSQLVALLAAAFVTVSTESIEFATNSRGYSSVMLLSTLAAGLTALQSYRERLWVWWALGVVHGLGFSFHPTYLFPFLCCQFWYVLSQNPKNLFHRTKMRRVVTSYFLSGAILALFYVPTWILSGPERMAGNGYVKRYTYFELWSDLKQFFPELLTTYHADFPLFLKGIMALGLLFYVFRKMDGWRVRVGLLAVPSFVVLGMYLIRPMDLEVRFLIFTLPVLLACEAMGIVSLLPNRVRNFHSRWVVGLVGVGLTFYSYQVTKPGLQPSVESISLDEGHQISQFLKPLLKRGDQVVYPAARGANLKYYFHVLGMDPKYIGTGKGAERIFFVLNLRLEDRYAYADSYRGFEPKDYTTPLVIAKYPGAEVTILEKKNGERTTPTFLSEYPQMPAKALRFLAHRESDEVRPQN